MSPGRCRLVPNLVLTVLLIALVRTAWAEEPRISMQFSGKAEGAVAALRSASQGVVVLHAEVDPGSFVTLCVEDTASDRAADLLAMQIGAVAVRRLDGSIEVMRDPPVHVTSSGNAVPLSLLVTGIAQALGKTPAIAPGSDSVQVPFDEGMNKAGARSLLAETGRLTDLATYESDSWVLVGPAEWIETFDLVRCWPLRHYCASDDRDEVEAIRQILVIVARRRGMKAQGVEYLRPENTFRLLGRRSDVDALIAVLRSIDSP